MSAFSTFVEEKIVQIFFKGNSYDGPNQLYLALFETNPGEDGNGVETEYSLYERQPINFSNFSNGFTKNTNAIAFPANGNTTASVEITHAAVFDGIDENTSNMIIYGQLAGSGKILQPNDVLAFAEEALTMSLD